MIVLRALVTAWNAAVYFLLCAPWLILLNAGEGADFVREAKWCDDCDYYGVDGDRDLCDDHADELRSLLGPAERLLIESYPML